MQDISKIYHFLICSGLHLESMPSSIGSYVHRRLVVAIEQADHVLEVAHVLSKGKAEVVEMILLLEHNLVSQLLRDKGHILRVCESVKIA